MTKSAGKNPRQSRRRFIRDAALLAFSSSLLPKGLVPVVLADEAFAIPGKDGLKVLNDRPINAETPAHLLDDRVTPASRLFVRNNGIPPETDGIDAAAWELRVDGEACARPQTFTLRDLQEHFKNYTLQLQIECGGNGRSEFNPPATGNQWSTGAVGCPEWTGVRLGDVLQNCGMTADAVYVAYEGADTHLSGDPDKSVISRGVPVRKAMEDESLIVWAINGEPLPTLHGYPLRMLCGGWPASVSGKWLQRIRIRDREHDGAKMTGKSYRVPCEAVAPGADVADEDMCIIESMPVKSLITLPKSGIEHDRSKPLKIRGHAWAGDRGVAEVHTSTDYGATWRKAALEKPVNRLAWQHWSQDVSFSQAGYHEIWARAVDDAGISQPMLLPGWNPRGYLNNACHRIALLVTV
jgi:DMSO/TMAO reductase YedYZ molybdopterin-dependent catalytic subunit